MKISGQFESVEAADNHAVIRSYIETCRRNDINEIDALQRLVTIHGRSIGIANRAGFFKPAS